MPSRDEHLAALRRAVDAGDINAANEIAAYLDANMPDASRLRQLDLEAHPRWEQALIGAGETVAELGAGIRNLIPESVREHLPQVRVNGQPVFGERNQREMAEAAQYTTPYKTAGKIGADIAMTAVPAFGVAARASTIPIALGKEAALMAAYEGAKLPGEDESRAGNAALAGGATLAGGAVLPAAAGALRLAGKAGGKILNKLAPISDDAQELLDAGVHLTPGMARPNLAPLEKLMTRVPGVAGATQRLQRQALEEWNQFILERAAPHGGLVAKAGAEGFEEVQRQYSKSYKALWQAVDPDSVAVDQVDTALADMIPRANEVGPEYIGVVNRVLKQADDYWKKFKTTGNPAHLEALDDALREAAGKVDGPSMDYFAELRQVFRNGLPAGSDDALRGLDRSYRDFMTATRAGGYVDASEAGNVFTPRQLLGASKARSSPRQTSTGKGTLQAEAAQGSRVITPPLRRMNATELEESVGPLMTAGAAAVAPVHTVSAIAGGHAMITPAMRNRLTGLATYSPEAIMRSLRTPSGVIGAGTALALSRDPHQRMIQALMNQARGPVDPAAMARALREKKEPQ